MVGQRHGSLHMLQMHIFIYLSIRCSIKINTVQIKKYIKYKNTKNSTIKQYIDKIHQNEKRYKN